MVARNFLYLFGFYFYFFFYSIVDNLQNKHRFVSISLFVLEILGLWVADSSIRPLWQRLGNKKDFCAAQRAENIWFPQAVMDIISMCFFSKKKCNMTD